MGIRSMGENIAVSPGVVAVPHWVLFLGGGASLCLLVFVVVMVAAHRMAVTERQAWHSYVTDQFYGLVWRWQYSRTGQITRLHSFCPACDYQVFAKDGHHFDGTRSVVFYCDSCQQHLGDIECNAETLELRVTRFIQQRIRKRASAATA